MLGHWGVEEQPPNTGTHNLAQYVEMPLPYPGHASGFRVRVYEQGFRVGACGLGFRVALTTSLLRTLRGHSPLKLRNTKP